MSESKPGLELSQGISGDWVQFNQVWALPNLITIYRGLTAVLIFIFSWTSLGLWIVFLIYLTGVVSDKLDGTLARRLKKETPLGVRMEPIMDALLAYAVIFYLVRHTDFPIYILWAGILVLIVGVGFTIIRTILGKKNFYVPNQIEGKAMIVLFHLTAILYFLKIPYREFALWATIIGGVFTFVSYLFRAHRFHSEKS